MTTETVTLPDGTLFPFWEDTTKYSKIYHVACEHPGASDENSGSEEQPFLTINKGARVLQPGEKVIVHGGTYRECVRPARGGLSPDQMIAYESAPGEDVFILGSEKLTGPYIPGEGWNFMPFGPPNSPTGEAKIWSVDIPVAWVTGYNPFMINNIISEFTSFTPDWTPEEVNRLLLRRGMLFCNGEPLQQVLKSGELGIAEGTFWVEDPGLRLYFRLPGDLDPSDVHLEAAVREQAFAPNIAGLGHIRVSGFQVRYVADGYPIPQRAAVSAYRGHHWIIEDCDIRDINAVAIDVGGKSWHRSQPVDPSVPKNYQAQRAYQDNRLDSGRHIIRRNLISDCGVCGVAGVGNVSYSLIEDNTIQNVAMVGIERLWETAGIKLHTCTGVLIRRNILRGIRAATAVWLDFLIENTRTTENLVYDVESLHGGLMIEASDVPNLIDYNILWDMRGVEDIWNSTSGVSGPAINIDTSEACIIAHNFIGNVPDEYAISVHLAQDERVIMDRYMLCRNHQVFNNLLTGCPKRVLLSKAENNQCEANFYDFRDDRISLCVEYPAPKACVNLESWQRNFRYDLQGGQAWIEAEFNPDDLTLTLEIQGEIPAAKKVDALQEERLTPGPWELKPGRQVIQIRAGQPKCCG